MAVADTTRYQPARTIRIVTSRGTIMMADHRRDIGISVAKKITWGNQGL